MSDNNVVYLTQERLIELENELKLMKTNGRAQMAQKISEARSHGDLSENAEYDAAKEAQGLFEMRLSKLEGLLSRARVIDFSQFPQGQVHILSTVKIRNLKSNKEMEYTLVSPEEADMNAGKISVTSPIGQGLMGKKLGDKLSINVPAGVIEIEILSLT